MKYNADNKILTIESINQCNEQYISNWINHNIEEVLNSKPVRSYRTNKLEISITVICKGYIVAIYNITDGKPDQFFIQTLGYSKANSIEK